MIIDNKVVEKERIVAQTPLTFKLGASADHAEEPLIAFLDRYLPHQHSSS